MVALAAAAVSNELLFLPTREPTKRGASQMTEEDYRADRFFIYGGGGAAIAAEPSKESVLADLMRVRGIGEAYANELYEKGVRSTKELVGAPGIPESIQLFARYIDDLEHELDLESAKKFVGWLEAFIMRAATGKKGHAHSLLAVEDVIIAGAHRRGVSSTHDIDVVVVGEREEGKTAMASQSSSISEAMHVILSPLPSYLGTLLRGEKKYSFLWKLFDNATVIDVVICPSSERGATLLHTTGPSTLNILLRKRAISLGMTLSEHGLFESGASKTLIHAATEEGIFKALGLPYIAAKDRDSEEAKKMVAAK
ncbi:MAG: hypothetical protein WC483_03365 [Candidatus Paceibacterota bacterium]